VQLCINRCEDFKSVHGKNGAYGGNINVLTISETHKMSASVHFESDAQFTHPLTFTVGQVVNERNVSLLFSGELDNISVVN
jgi:hypothetical protein